MGLMRYDAEQKLMYDLVYKELVDMVRVEICFKYLVIILDKKVFLV